MARVPEDTDPTPVAVPDAPKAKPGGNRRYTAKSGLCTIGSNCQTYLYAPPKKSIVIE